MSLIMCKCGMKPLGTTYIRGQKPVVVMHEMIVHSVTICYDLNPDSKETTMLDFSSYVRKPFVVQAVEITKDNIEAVAEHVGDLKTKDDGTPYILVDKRLVPNVSRVYIGFFMTKMGENIRCYSRKIFHDQFVAETEDIAQWVEYLNGSNDG